MLRPLMEIKRKAGLTAMSARILFRFACWDVLMEPIPLVLL
jgi:hypothetical protein